jgi:uncharacterized membrane protein
MLKKIMLAAILFLCITNIFAQQIPVGMCGIVYIYDANGARVKRTYFCNNGLDPYPTARVVAIAFANSTDRNKIPEEKGNTAMFEKIEAIFPNPTSGKFFITFSNTLVNANISIVDALGRIVYQNKGNGNRLEFDISNFATGIFYVRIEENGKTITQKIIKQ